MTRRRRGLIAAALAGGGLTYAHTNLTRQVRRKLSTPRRIWQAAQTHPIRGFAAVLFGYLWSRTGQLLLAATLTVLLMAAGVGAWNWYRFRKTGLTVTQAAKQLRLERRVQRGWTKAIVDGTNLVKTGDVVPPLKRIRFEDGDITARVYPGAYAITTDKVIPNLNVVRDVLHCRDVTYAIPENGTLDLRFEFSNPLEKIVLPSDLKAPRDGAAPYGLTRSGQPMSLPILNRDGSTAFTPVLVGGVTGAGKSSFLWAVLAGLIAMRIPVELWVSDPAGGVELAALGAAYDARTGTDLFRVRRYVGSNDPKHTNALVQEFNKAMHSRLATMKGTGKLHTPTPAEPLQLLICDELLQLGDSLLKGGVHSPFGLTLSAGRKAGFSAIALTQIGEKAVIGSARELFRRRVCFATDTREMTETILGSGGRADQAPAHTIPETTPGVGYAFAEGSRTIEKFRAAYFDDAACVQIANGDVPAGMEHFLPEPEPEVPWAVYRLFGFPAADGARVLEYLGSTNDPRRRFAEHQRDKKWARRIDWGAARIEWYDTRAEALAAETEAIRREMPRRNGTSNEDNPLRVLDDGDAA